MPQAEFSSSVTYSPPGGGLLTQAFGVTANYASASAGTVAISAKADPHPIAIPFGGIGADARGLVVRNNTAVDLGIRLNGATSDLYRLAPGGLIMHWAPASAGASALTACTVAPAVAAPSDGSIDYLVFGT